MLRHAPSVTDQINNIHMNHYRYTDFSNFTKKDASSAEARNAATLAVRQAAVSASQLSGERVSSLTSGSTSASASFNRSELLAQVLPYKLDAMLSDPSISHIITWMPHGRGTFTFYHDGHMFDITTILVGK